MRISYAFSCAKLMGRWRRAANYVGTAQRMHDTADDSEVNAA